MDKRITTLLTITTLVLTACDNRTEEEKGQDAVNGKASYLQGFGNELRESGRDAAVSLSGGVTEVWKGFAEGFEGAPIDALVVEEGLVEAGVECTRIQLSGPHLINTYLVLSKPMERQLVLKALDADDVEIGRAMAILRSKADEAGYVDFEFDQRTRMIAVKGFHLSSRPIPVKEEISE